MFCCPLLLNSPWATSSGWFSLKLTRISRTLSTLQVTVKKIKKKKPFLVFSLNWVQITRNLLNVTHLAFFHKFTGSCANRVRMLMNFD